jgi:multiple sugar transport system permease protein
MKRKKLAGKIAAYIILSIGALIMVLPFIWMLSTAFKPQAEVFRLPPSLIGSRIEFGNFARVSNRFPFWLFFLNSLKISAIVVVVQLITSSMAGFGFSRLKFRGRELIFFFYLATMMIPAQVTIIPNFLLMGNLGMVNTHQALILPALVSAFGTFLMRQFFITVPPALEEAAKIDGCTPFGVYWRVFLPLSTPTTATLAIFVLMGIWNDYYNPLIYITTVEKMTLPLGLALMQGMYSTDWTVLMAGTTLSLIPIITAFLFAQDLFVKGVMLSGVKE